MASSFDLDQIVDTLGDLEFRQLAEFNAGSLGVFRTGAGVSPWEMHPDTDELLVVLDGEVAIRILDPDRGRGDVVLSLAAGHAAVVPARHWHRHEASGPFRELYLTPGATEHSSAEDPRTG